MKYASVVGSGKWGSAIAGLLAQKHQALLYSRDITKKSHDNKIIITHNIDDVLKSKYLFVAIPAQQIQSFLKLVRGLSKDTVIILCSKGIDISTGKLLSEIVADVLPNNAICALSGPNFASEVAEKKLTISTISSNNIKIADEIAKNFSTEYFRFIANNDIISTQVFGALKNVLAIACGIVRGLGMGENAVAAILTLGINEIITVARKYGAKNVEITSPAGIGDIFLSCNSSTSRNNEFGVLLAQGKEIDQEIVVEGKHTIIALSENLQDMLSKLPLLNFVYKMVTKKLSGAHQIKRELFYIFDFDNKG
jgi:glycerol-3-phosphate dehydrogenase (NAD(P)+)